MWRVESPRRGYVFDAVERRRQWVEQLGEQLGEQWRNHRTLPLPEDAVRNVIYRGLRRSLRADVTYLELPPTSVSPSSSVPLQTVMLEHDPAPLPEGGGRDDPPDRLFPLIHRTVPGVHLRRNEETPRVTRDPMPHWLMGAPRNLVRHGWNEALCDFKMNCSRPAA